MPFDNRWNQHAYTSLTLLPFGLWAPAIAKKLYGLLSTPSLKKKQQLRKNGVEIGNETIDTICVVANLVLTILHSCMLKTHLMKVRSG